MKKEFIDSLIIKTYEERLREIEEMEEEQGFEFSHEEFEQLVSEY